MSGDWLANARRMPVAFAQVREDPRIDLAVLTMLGRTNLSGLMIASGGCTAAALAASSRLGELHIVDINAAQLALTRLKLHLLCNSSSVHRCELLGHAPMPMREAALTSTLRSLDLAPDVFGPPALVAELGPDHAGRYELLFSALREAMAGEALDWASLLRNGDVRNGDAALLLDPGTPLGAVMDRAFDDVMALDNLIALFGEAATQNSAVPFSQHFATRTRHAIKTLRPKHNPFLWQMLAGRFPPNGSYDWLTMPAPRTMPRLTWSHSAMDAVLADIDRRFDFIHLSNILDWLAPEQAARVLRLTHRALKPGGLTIIRQLNSSLDLPALCPDFHWLTDEANALHAVDRSFFYRQLHLGRRP